MRYHKNLYPGEIAADQEKWETWEDKSRYTIFPGQMLLEMQRPLVYMWTDSNDNPLYVGSSRQGLSRIFNPQHHRLKHMSATDKVHTWMRYDEGHWNLDPVDSEFALMRLKEPRYNAWFKKFEKVTNA